MVHDIQFDYYGRRLATCSSDRSIKVFNTAGDQAAPEATLLGHEGPVWQVSWAHPKFGNNILASCSFDHKIIVWKETQTGYWTQIYNAQVHTASVNSIAFAPHELGLVLASASSDGCIAVLTYQPDGTWLTEKIEGAHSVGVNAVSWAPATPAGSLLSAQGTTQPDRRLTSCGCDNAVKVWQKNEQQGQWLQQGGALLGHTDWVRDVAWGPNLGLPRSTIASAGQDGLALVWTEDASGAWTATQLCSLGEPVWRVSWSITGTILAVSDAKDNVTLWKEISDGQWEQVDS
ncbi:hypothetical protein WJX73_001199 [Symbiochloris irregularis]|uniref:Uncharacterized protein n=1 Tax=Symbiochloris irregularis TaxID=706552 RepID=A0AAW1P454_9CHLO